MKLIFCLICRLSLPGKIVENGHEKAAYDSDKGLFVDTSSCSPKIEIHLFLDV